MHKLVKEYLKDKQEKAKDSELRKRNELLLELGLYEIKYSDDNESSPEYPLSEWDEENKVYKYYKKVPVEVSDDEYAQILSYQKEISEEGKKNAISNIFRALAWIVFICGFIAGIGFGLATGKVEGYYSSYNSAEFSFTVAFIYWVISFISGMFFLGFAEIIQLLTDIKNK